MFEDISCFFMGEKTEVNLNPLSTYVLLRDGTYYEVVEEEAKKLTDLQLRLYCAIEFKDKDVSIYRPG